MKTMVADLSLGSLSDELRSKVAGLRPLALRTMVAQMMDLVVDLKTAYQESLILERRQVAAYLQSWSAELRCKTS